jgi:hypothetical protein
MRKEQVRKEMLCCSSSGDVEKVLHNAALYNEPGNSDRPRT